ncbi:MAG: hypothetical protein ACLR4X_11200 [Clostridia bacterium]
MRKSELQSILRDLEGYKIILTKETYKKEGRKNFPKNPLEVTTEEITTEEYDKIFSSGDFFKSLGGVERSYKSYTLAGYIPTRLVSISPNRETKITRRISIERY